MLSLQDGVGPGWDGMGSSSAVVTTLTYAFSGKMIPSRLGLQQRPQCDSATKMIVQAPYILYGHEVVKIVNSGSVSGAVFW